MPKAQLRSLRFIGHFTFLFRWKWVQHLMKRHVEKKVFGPDEQERAHSSTFFYGDAQDPKGQRVAMTMKTPNGYSLTYDTALSATEEVLRGTILPGAYTPSSAFGSDFITRMQGVACTKPTVTEKQK